MAVPPKFPILFCGDNPAGVSGYATQLALFLPRLKALGWDVTCFAPNYAGEPLNVKGIRVLPRFNDRWGNDAIIQHVRHTVGNEGLTFLLSDVWTFKPELLKRCGAVAAWTPVDHEPLQWATHEALRDSGAFPVAMTRWAQESFATAGFDSVYIPHAFDPEIYKPRPRDEAREFMQIPNDAFVVGIVGDNQGNNPPRKAWAHMLEAFSIFRKSKKEAVAYLHTDILGAKDGLDLGRLIQQLEIPPDAIRVVDPWEYLSKVVSQKTMSYLYSSFDTLLHTSFGEGFGVCTLEANACGTPVISTRFSAMPEVAYGWHVDYDKWYTVLGGWQACPRVDDIVSKLHAAYQRADSRRQAAFEHAQPYAVDTVMEQHMLPGLDEIGRRFGL